HDRLVERVRGQLGRLRRGDPEQLAHVVADVAELVAHVPELLEQVAHQVTGNINKSSLVMKKSLARISTDAITTERIVARPTPWVPPVVLRPRKQPTVERMNPNTMGLVSPMVTSFTTSALPTERQ